MIKVFTTNKNGKIELSKDELKNILDEAYWDGYRAGNCTTYTYTTPSWTPYRWTTNGVSTTLNSNDITGGTLRTTVHAENTAVSATNATTNTSTKED